jgi:hypothetical protein
VFPVGIGLRDPRSQKRDLGHPSISPFDIAEGTCFVISLPTRKTVSPLSNRGHSRILRNRIHSSTCRHSTANEPDSSDRVPLSLETFIVESEAEGV